MKNLDSILQFMLWFGFGTLAFGLFQKITHRGGGTYVTIGVVMLLLQFLISSYLTKEKNKSFIDKLSKVMFWVGSFFFMFGILFKIQHWPGNIFLLFFGIVFLFAHYMLYFYSSKKDNENE